MGGSHTLLRVLSASWAAMSAGSAFARSVSQARCFSATFWGGEGMGQGESRAW